MDELRRDTRHSKEDPAKQDPARTRRKSLEAACKKSLDEALDVGLEETFPGSDPVAIVQPVRGACGKDRQ
jgi:hypothetical protein